MMGLPGTCLYIALSFALILLNAFFVASEFAIVKVRRTRLEELAGMGVAAARVSILCVDQLDEYLSATQLGITLVSLGLGWIGEESFYALFVQMIPVLATGGSGVVHAIAAGSSFLLITMLHVVLGELVPKSMAIQKAEAITLKISKPLRIFFRLASPLIRTFAWMANCVLRLLGFPGLEEAPLSEDELKILLKESREEGVISESEAQIINRAFSFSDKRAADIMIPASRAEFLSLARPIEANIAVMRSRMHTRFPLTREANLSSVIGVVHVKDLLFRAEELSSNTALERVARPLLSVDASMREDQLLRVMRENRVHLALVSDPRTRVAIGLVTMEDILEELVGEIQDEHGN